MDETPSPHLAMIRPFFRALAAVPLLAWTLAAGLGAQPRSELPLTFQERNDFRAGPTPYAQLMAFWRDLDTRSDLVSMRSLARTIGGRELALVTISSTPIRGPQDAIRSRKTVVLLAPSVHGGESSPKEAVQVIGRELVGGRLRPLLDDVIVLIVPVLNPDGGESLSRTNEAGLDLNRDYVKLESEEIHTLVTQVMNVWNPQIHVDGHHGGANPYVITYQGTLNPAADAELRAYPYERIFPRIDDAVRAEGYEAFHYSGPRVVNGVEGWGSTSVEPRKHHTYTGLTNSIGILLETPDNTHRFGPDGTLMQVPFRERYYHQVRGGVIAMTEILEVAAEEREEILSLTDAARRRAIEAGERGGDPFVVEYRLAARGLEEVWMPDRRQWVDFSRRRVPVFLRWDPVRTVPRPVGYLLTPEMERVVPLLQDHAIEVYRVQGRAAVDAEVYYATDIRADELFEGHYLKRVRAERKAERIEVGPGWLWVPTAQSRANLISYLLEPETDDNLVTWGFADHVVEVTVRGGRPPVGRQRLPMIRVATPQEISVVPATGTRISRRP